MTNTLNSNSSLKSIKQMVADDFDIIIDNETAKAIREANRTNTLMWDATKIVTTNSSSIRIRKVNGGKVEANVEFKYQR